MVLLEGDTEPGRAGNPSKYLPFDEFPGGYLMLSRSKPDQGERMILTRRRWEDAYGITLGETMTDVLPGAIALLAIERPSSSLGFAKGELARAGFTRCL